eukprot:m.136670 g.136670  ORF g.136670 m.136670 type:complete len:882 (-) comp16979_c0_seq1:214-2859(-)
MSPDDKAALLDAIESIREQSFQGPNLHGILSWSMAEVCDWLDANDLGSHRKEFSSRHIDGRALLKLTHSDLFQMHVRETQDQSWLLERIAWAKQHCWDEQADRPRWSQYWTDKEVGAWLDAQGLPELPGYDGMDLHRLDEATLSKLHLTASERSQVLEAVAVLQAQQDLPAPSTEGLSDSLPVFRWSEQQVEQWLVSENLDGCQLAFQGQAIDGVQLASMDTGRLQRLGVTRAVERDRLLTLIADLLQQHPAPSKLWRLVLWSVSEVGAWLERCGLFQYCRTFAENNINGQQLLVLKAMDLCKLGIEADQEHLLILQEIDALRREALEDLNEQPVQAWGADQVEEWLMAAGFPQYRRSFAISGVDGRKLLSLTAANLASLGVEKSERTSVLAAIESLEFDQSQLDESGAGLGSAPMSPLSGGSHAPLDVSLLSEAWFSPSFTAADAEAHLLDRPLGSFVVRQPPACEAPMLSYVSDNGQVVHHAVFSDARGQFGLQGSLRTFSSLPDLVQSYVSNADVLSVPLVLPERFHTSSGANGAASASAPSSPTGQGSADGLPSSPTKRWNFVGQKSQEALAVLHKNDDDGAFVVYTKKPSNMKQGVLSFVYKNKVKHEKIKAAGGDIQSSEVYLSSDSKKKFESLDKLVEFYAEKQSALPVALSVPLEELPPSWLQIGQPRGRVCDMLNRCGPGAFAVILQNSKPVLIFNHDDTIQTRPILLLDRGFCLEVSAVLRSDAFPTLEELVSFLSKSLDSLPCRINFDSMDLFPQSMTGAWPWCQVLVPKEEAAGVLQDYPQSGRFIICSASVEHLKELLLLYRAGDNVFREKIVEQWRGAAFVGFRLESGTATFSCLQQLVLHYAEEQPELNCALTVPPHISVLETMSL